MFLLGEVVDKAISIPFILVYDKAAERLLKKEQSATNKKSFCTYKALRYALNTVALLTAMVICLVGLALYGATWLAFGAAVIFLLMGIIKYPVIGLLTASGLLLIVIITAFIRHCNQDWEKKKKEMENERTST